MRIGLFAVLLAFAAPAQDRLTNDQERGRQIYERGTSPSGGAIEAALPGNTRVAAAIVPCVNCHGRNGVGKPEGGVVPSNITWEELTKPYGIRHADGRTHGAYTERLLKKAITMGIDPAGNTLNAAMPRFQLSMADADDLVAYIKTLSHAADPGVTDRLVRLGVIAPPLSTEGGAMVRGTLLDYFARVNGAGGIFGRQVELAFAELPVDAAKSEERLQEFLTQQEIFAVIGDFTGAESAIARVMHDTGTPAIAARAPFPQTGSPMNRYVFYLDGGLKEELDVLVQYASQKGAFKDRKTVIVSNGSEIAKASVRRIQQRLAGSNEGGIAVTDGRKAADADVIIWLRPEIGALRQFGADTQQMILIPRSILTSVPEIPEDLSGQVLFMSGSVSALMKERIAASAALLSEALRIAGRGLSREGLITALESLQGAQGNLDQPVTFGPNRRIGSTTVRALRFDPPSGKFIPTTGGG